MNVFGDIVELVNGVELPDPGRWDAVFALWDEVSAELDAALPQTTPETLNGAGAAGQAALELFDQAFDLGQADLGRVPGLHAGLPGRGADRPHGRHHHARHRVLRAAGGRGRGRRAGRPPGSGSPPARPRSAWACWAARSAPTVSTRAAAVVEAMDVMHDLVVEGQSWEQALDDIDWAHDRPGGRRRLPARLHRRRAGVRRRRAGQVPGRRRSVRGRAAQAARLGPARVPAAHRGPARGRGRRVGRCHRRARRRRQGRRRRRELRAGRAGDARRLPARRRGGCRARRGRRCGVRGARRPHPRRAGRAAGPARLRPGGVRPPLPDTGRVAHARAARRVGRRAPRPPLRRQAVLRQGRGGVRGRQHPGPPRAHLRARTCSRTGSRRPPCSTPTPRAANRSPGAGAARPRGGDGLEARVRPGRDPLQGHHRQGRPRRGRRLVGAVARAGACAQAQPEDQPARCRRCGGERRADDAPARRRLHHGGDRLSARADRAGQPRRVLRLVRRSR